MQALINLKNERSYKVEHQRVVLKMGCLTLNPKNGYLQDL
jgi:hypothetical protein